jgi:hypothetical protein
LDPRIGVSSTNPLFFWTGFEIEHARQPKPFERVQGKCLSMGHICRVSEALDGTAVIDSGEALGNNGFPRIIV